MRKFSIDLSSLSHITIIFHTFHTIKKKLDWCIYMVEASVQKFWSLEEMIWNNQKVCWKIDRFGLKKFFINHLKLNQNPESFYLRFQRFHTNVFIC